MDSRANTFSAEELLAHAAFVRRLARRLVGDRHEAEDVAQEALLAALRKPPAILTSLKSWLAGVTRNVVRMRRRTEGRRATRERVAAQGEAVLSSSESAATMEMFRLLTDAVDELGEPNRTTVLMRYYQGMKPGEIASALNVPVKTVKTRLNRSLGRLRARLDERHGDRAAWCALLLPFAKPPSPIGTAPVVSGAILMSLKTKVTLVAAAAVVLFAAAGVYVSTLDEEFTPVPSEVAELPDPPVQDSPRPAVDAEATTDPKPTRAAPPPVAPGTARVRVRVLDAESGAPVPHVLVYQHDITEDYTMGEDDDESMVVDEVIEDPENTIRSRTGEGGRATLVSKPGPRLLVVRHPRYRDFLGKRFALRDGGDREATIRLVPYPKDERELDFRGTVTDGQAGHALGGVRVLCRFFDGTGVVTLDTTTDAEGRFGHRVPANTVIALKYTLEGYEDKVRALNPVHQDWLNGDAALLRIGGGPKRGEARLTGLITDAATGQPIAGVSVVLLRSIGSWTGFTSDRQGRFRIDTRTIDGEEETVRVGIAHPGYERYRSEQITIAPDRTVEHSIALKKADSSPGIAGRVVDDRTGDPVAGAKVSTEAMFGQALERTTAGEDGAFGMQLRGTENEIKVTAEGYWPWTKVIRDDVKARPESLRSLVIRLRRADATIRGTVRDAASGKALEGVSVSLFFEPEWCGPGPTAVTNAKGKYAFKVPAGRYAFRGVFEGYGAGCSNATTVEAGGTATADIALHVRDCVVTGRVLDAATGEEIARGEDVFFHRLPNEGEEQSICDLTKFGAVPKVDGDGAGYTARLVPGRYEVILTARGYRRHVRTITVRKGERVTFDVSMTPEK